MSFVESRVITKVALRPHHGGNMIAAVKGQLNDMLLKYSEDIEGVAVSYSDLELPKGMEYGRIIGAEPWVHVDLRATMVVFRPIRGLRLMGMVSQVSDSHVWITKLKRYQRTHLHMPTLLHYDLLHNSVSIPL